MVPAYPDEFRVSLDVGGISKQIDAHPVAGNLAHSLALSVAMTPWSAMYFLVRKLKTGWAVWDCKAKAPATLDGRTQVGLSIGDAENAANLLNAVDPASKVSPLPEVVPTDDGDRLLE